MNEIYGEGSDRRREFLAAQGSKHLTKDEAFSMDEIEAYIKELIGNDTIECPFAEGFCPKANTNKCSIENCEFEQELLNTARGENSDKSMNPNWRIALNNSHLKPRIKD